MRAFLVLSFAVVASSHSVPFFLKTYPSFPSNTSAGVCENYYEFVCSAWEKANVKPSNEPVWSVWVAAGHETNKKLTKLLKNTENAGSGLEQAQTFYRTCVRFAKLDYLPELNSLVETLGGFPVVNRAWNEDSFDWIKQISVITRLVAIYPILKIKIDIDYHNPKQYMLYVEPGDLIFPNNVLTNPAKYGVELQAYEKWIYETIRVVNASHGHADFDMLEVKEIIKFEMRLASLLEVKKQKTLRLTLGRLSQKIPEDFVAAFSVFLQDFHAISLNSTVTVRNYSYLKNLSFLIRKTSRKTVANYLIWAVVKELSRDTSQQLRNLNFLINRAVFDVKKDFSREFECVSKTVEHFSPVLAKEYAAGIDSSAVKRIEEMVAGIKQVLIERIARNGVISEDGKRLVAEKVERIRVFIGYPSWYANEALTERYRVIHMTENHFLNVFLLKNFKMAEELVKYGKAVERVEWPSSPFDVNAFYSILQNAIFIPLGLMQKPFFHVSNSEASNYGALGSLIGHELTHSIDPMGILADKNGRVARWLSQKDRETARNLTRCYRENFESAGEIIADKVGLEISSEALKFGDFRAFFASFAEMWCEIGSETDLLFTDEHAPVSDRVTMALQHNRKFHEVFNCGGGVKEGCEVW